MAENKSRQLQMIERSAALTSIAINALLAKQQAEATLAVAQTEGWAADDPRWEEAFKGADAALAAAQARL